MNLLSDRINLLAESETLEMAKKAREMKNNGFDIINLSLGEPDFQTPIHIKEAAKRALDEGFTFYTPVPGYLELRDAICKKLERDNNLKYQPNQIVVSAGAKQSIANVILCTVNSGDEVIVLTPYWVSYREIIKLAGGVPIYVEGKIENEFKINPSDLESAITSKTKAIIYSSPSNPTGCIYSKDELKAMADILAKYPNLLIISDEIYEYINFEQSHESIAQFENVRNQVVIVNGFSKGFAMTGWRVGYIAAPQWLAAACEKMQGQFTSGICSIAQRAALEALISDLTPTHQMTEAYKKRRDLVLSLMKDVKGVISYTPKGAFYVFPDISYYFGKRFESTQINNANDLSMFLLSDALVSTVTGDAFGSPNCIRISYAASEENLIKAFSRIKTSLKKLS